MMVQVFATATVALALAYLGWPRLAAASAALCFVLAVWLFLFEIYSPETGFRMPWLQGARELLLPGRA